MPDLIKLKVVEVRTAVPAGAGVEAGMVALAEEAEPYRTLRIVIGQPEARAIQAAWRGAVAARPSTWELFVSTVALLGARVEQVVITAVEQERYFYASMDLEREGQQWSVGCRPSDAIALALRSDGCAIFAAPEVLDAAGFLPGGGRLSELSGHSGADPSPAPTGETGSNGTPPATSG